MSDIIYAVGDATLVSDVEPCIIAHVVNNVGAWGRGFTAPLETRYPGQAEIYRRWAKRTDALSTFGLGHLLVARTSSPNVYVAHLCAQDGLPSIKNPHPLDYEALEGALGALAAHVAGDMGPRPTRVQMPRIGVGLARGNWTKVAPIIERTLCVVTSVTVLDLPKSALSRGA